MKALCGPLRSTCILAENERDAGNHFSYNELGVLKNTLAVMENVDAGPIDAVLVLEEEGMACGPVSMIILYGIKGCLD